MKKTKNILYGVGLIIGLLIYSGIKELNKSKRKEKVDEITGEIFKNEKIPNSTSYFIGSSSFKIKSPYLLKESTVAFPENIKEQIEKMEIFEFEKNPYFEGKVSYIKWNNSVTYDLNAGVDGSIDNVRNLPGVEKVVENREFFENSNYQAYFFDAIMIRDSKTGFMNGSIFKSGQEVWLLYLGFTDSKYESMVDDILASLKENK